MNMRETTEERMERLAFMKEIKEKLKECKPEWLEKNQKGQDSLGVSTVQQILDYATGGLWDFVIQEQWREDVQKYNKSTSQYVFDGYVYHVRGQIFIDGLGSRSQYGSKVAIGGKDNQNSSYKSAASDCLKKCASLFGVGSSVYSKIKIETEDDLAQIQNNSNYAIGNQQQQQPVQQVEQPVTYLNADGLHQSGEYIYFNNAWVHQNEYYAMKQQQQVQPMSGGQYPSPGLTGEQASLQQTMLQVDQEMAQGNIEVPFEQPARQEQPVVAQNFEAQAQPEAQPQAQAQPQDFQATAYGAPVIPKEPEQPKEQVDPLAHIQVNNPWMTLENQQSLEMFRQHKERLSIAKDSDLLPYVRDYFKDEKAELSFITPEVLIGFNTHLQNIAV
jgi:hypothetical protein